MAQINPDAAPRRLGDIWRRIAQLERIVAYLKSAQGILSKATIGRGGITVKDGGGVAVEGGGGVEVRDGGIILAYHPDGSPAARFGSWQNLAGKTVYGIASLDREGNVLFGAHSGDPEAEFGGGTSVQVGNILKDIDGFTVSADFLTLNGRYLDIKGPNPEGAALAPTLRLTDEGIAVMTDATVGQRLRMPGVADTSSSANVRLTTDGWDQIRRVTSSRRYKQDIADHDPDPAAVLKMQGRTWRDKAEVEDDPDTERRHVGFIAEELDEIGLTEFVEYVDGEPDAIAYDRLSVALLSVVKDQQARIERLERLVESR